VRPITSRAPLPRYQEIADALRRAIIDGTLAPGERVPPAGELAHTYQVARPTAEKATAELLREGMLISRPGAGLFVRERPKVTRMVRSWYQQPGTGSPWRAEMAAAGRDGGWESSSEATEATPAVAERLQLTVGAPVMRTHYTFTLEGDPVYLSTSWEPLAITSGTAVMLPEAGPYAGIGVRDRMAVIGHAPDYCAEEVLPHTLTVNEAEKLGLHPGIACTLVQRIYREGGPTGTPLEIADIVLPPHYRAVYEIPIPTGPAGA
jgi:GntR family transcriptional regulator